MKAKEKESKEEGYNSAIVLEQGKWYASI